MTYKFNCKHCNKEVEITCSMKEIKEKMPCPECGEECSRIYSPIMDVWHTSGNYSATR